MLTISKLTKRFGGITAVDACSLAVAPHTITALIGPNGAGKTTLFNLISGLITPDAGTVEMDGQRLNGLRPHERANRGLARTFQAVRLFKNLTVEQNILLAAQPRDQRFWRCLALDRDDASRRKIRAVLKLVGFPKEPHTVAADLSYGSAKLLELARALLLPHRVLLLDEPVAGVSPHLRIELKSLLRELQRRGETVLLIEHDMEFVFSLAETVVVMNAGKILRQGTPQQIQRDPEVLQAYLGGQL